jgi:hypothetical protein
VLIAYFAHQAIHVQTVKIKRCVQREHMPLEDSHPAQLALQAINVLESLVLILKVCQLNACQEPMRMLKEPYVLIVQLEATVQMVLSRLFAQMATHQQLKHQYATLVLQDFIVPLD